MEEIYKINQLVFNNSKSQFCLCYNNGIKTFTTNDFKEKCSSNDIDKIGSVSRAVLLYELNIVAFIGTENNESYDNKRLSVYDLIKKKIIFSTPFLSPITDLKSIDKYLIFNLKHELNIYSFEKMENVIPITTVPLPDPLLDLYEVWEKPNELTSKIYIAFLFEKEIIISTYMSKDWSFEKKIAIKSPFYKIQGLFYISQINQLFVVDENAGYIYSYDIDNGKQISSLYRGKNPGIITSMTLVNKNYLAICNLNRTIHIFDLDIKNNAFSISNAVFGFFYGQQIIYACLKIPFEELIAEKEGEFYDLDFQKKGAIITSEEDSFELKVIAYNGFAYKIRLNFIKKKFEVVLKEKYSATKSTGLKEESLKEEEKVTEQPYNSIFDPEKKKETEKDKYVVYQ